MCTVDKESVPGVSVGPIIYNSIQATPFGGSIAQTEPRSDAGETVRVGQDHQGKLCAYSAVDRRRAQQGGRAAVAGLAWASGPHHQEGRANPAQARKVQQKESAARPKEPQLPADH